MSYWGRDDQCDFSKIKMPGQHSYPVWRSTICMCMQKWILVEMSNVLRGSSATSPVPKR